MNWILKPWSELTTDELYELLALRAEVFVVEQTCPFQDLDGLDRREGVKACEARWPTHSIWLGAQAHLQGFYGQNGFVAEGAGYVEDDIPHIGMRKTVA